MAEDSAERIPCQPDKVDMASITDKMNDIPTSKIAYDGLRKVTYGSDDIVREGPSLPWQLLKARLPRQPTVFVVLPPASAGDSGPFTRVLDVCHHCSEIDFRLLTCFAGARSQPSRTVPSPLPRVRIDILGQEHRIDQESIRARQGDDRRRRLAVSDALYAS